MTSNLSFDDSLPPINPMSGAGGFIAAVRESRFALAVDPGQSIDPTAICVVERVREPIPPEQGGVGADLFQQLGPPIFHVRWLERLPLQTSYIVVVAHVANLLQHSPLRGNCRLILDRTGVGRPVADLFTHGGLDPVSVTITAGDQEHVEADGSGWRVSKLQLISRLQAELHAGNLKIAKSLPEAAALASELSDFRVHFSDAGFSSFGARVGKHDDLVLALSLALWHLVGPRMGGRWWSQPLEL